MVTFLLVVGNVCASEGPVKAAPAYAEDLYQRKNPCKDKDVRIAELEKLNSLLKKKIALLETENKKLKDKANIK
jgi:hypothetical protein